MPEKTARILVEGGPVHRRVNRLLAAIIGLIMGGGLGLGGVAFVALKATHEIAGSRVAAAKISCRDANRRHHEAGPQLVSLLARGAPIRDRAVRAGQEEAIRYLAGGTPPRTALGRLEAEEIKGFVQIIAPAYNCRRRVAELTRP